MSTATMDRPATAPTAAKATPAGLASVDSLRKATAAAKDKARDDYRAIVKQFARSPEGIKSEDVFAACNNAGRSLDHFEKDVNAARARLQAVVDLQTAAEMSPAIEEANLQSKMAVDDHDALVKDHLASMEISRARVRDAGSTASNLSRKKNDLERSAKLTLRGTFDPTIRQQVDDMQRELENRRENIARQSGIVETHKLIAAAQAKLKPGDANSERQAQQEVSQIRAVAESRNWISSAEHVPVHEKGLKTNLLEVARLEKEIAVLSGLESDPLAGMAWTP